MASLHDELKEGSLFPAEGAALFRVAGLLSDYGHTSKVWNGFRVEGSDKQVVIKVLRSIHGNAPKYREDFVAEIARLQKVREKGGHVPEVVGDFSNLVPPAFVMTKAPGRTLRNAVAQDTKLGVVHETAALEIGIPVLETLAAAHSLAFSLVDWDLGEVFVDDAYTLRDAAPKELTSQSPQVTMIDLNVVRNFKEHDENELIRGDIRKFFSEWLVLLTGVGALPGGLSDRALENLPMWKHLGGMSRWMQSLILRGLGRGFPAFETVDSLLGEWNALLDAWRRPSEKLPDHINDLLGRGVFERIRFLVDIAEKRGLPTEESWKTNVLDIHRVLSEVSDLLDQVKRAVISGSTSPEALINQANEKLGLIETLGGDQTESLPKCDLWFYVIEAQKDREKDSATLSSSDLKSQESWEMAVSLIAQLIDKQAEPLDVSSTQTTEFQQVIDGRQFKTQFRYLLRMGVVSNALRNVFRKLENNGSEKIPLADIVLARDKFKEVCSAKHAGLDESFEQIRKLVHDKYLHDEYVLIQEEITKRNETVEREQSANKWREYLQEIQTELNPGTAEQARSLIRKIESWDGAGQIAEPQWKELLEVKNKLVKRALELREKELAAIARVEEETRTAIESNKRQHFMNLIEKCKVDKWRRPNEVDERAKQVTTSLSLLPEVIEDVENLGSMTPEEKTRLVSIIENIITYLQSQTNKRDISTEDKATVWQVKEIITGLTNYVNVDTQKQTLKMHYENRLCTWIEKQLKQLPDAIAKVEDIEAATSILENLQQEIDKLLIDEFVDLTTSDQVKAIWKKVESKKQTHVEMARSHKEYVKISMELREKLASIFRKYSSDKERSRHEILTAIAVCDYGDVSLAVKEKIWFSKNGDLNNWFFKEIQELYPAIKEAAKLGGGVGGLADPVASSQLVSLADWCGKVTFESIQELREKWNSEKEKIKHTQKENVILEEILFSLINGSDVTFNLNRLVSKELFRTNESLTKSIQKLVFNSIDNWLEKALKKWNGLDHDELKSIEDLNKLVLIHNECDKNTKEVVKKVAKEIVAIIELRESAIKLNNEIEEGLRSKTVLNSLNLFTNRFVSYAAAEDRINRKWMNIIKGNKQLVEQERILSEYKQITDWLNVNEMIWADLVQVENCDLLSESVIQGGPVFKAVSNYARSQLR